MTTAQQTSRPVEVVTAEPVAVHPVLSTYDGPRTIALDPAWDDPAALPALIAREAARVPAPLEDPEWQSLLGARPQAAQ